MVLLCRLQSQLGCVSTMSKTSSSGPISISPKYWRMLVSNSNSSSPNRIHYRTPTTLIGTTFSNNSYCNSNSNSFCSSNTNPLRHPCPAHPGIRRESQPGAFGWFDSEDDGDKNWKQQDEEAQEFEFEDRPEIPEALRQAFLKQQAQAAAELEAYQCEGL